ncbi:MAG: IS630 family transposase [Puniceicoccales bacterium]
MKTETQGWRMQRLFALNLGFDSRQRDEDIVEAVGCSRATLHRWFAAYRKGGLDVVLRREYEGGRPLQCDADIAAFLEQGLKAARWNTAVQAQQDLEVHFGRRFYYKTVWRWLKKAAGVMRVPRPVHEKRNPIQAEAFKRHFYGELKALPLAHGRPVKVWFADESRYGLLPNLRRVWTQKGLRPHKKWQSKYQWSYCYGALDIVEGQAVFLQTPTVNLDWTRAFLEQIKTEFPGYEHIVVWDGAGFHPREDDHHAIPESVHTIMLPPYSPELNPIEKLWDCIQDYTANKLWPSIERLDQVIALLLEQWWEEPRRIIKLVGNNCQRATANVS